MKTFVSLLVALLCATAAPHALSIQAICSTPYRQDGTCADSAQTRETPVQSMMRWGPVVWQNAKRACLNKKIVHGAEYGGVPCSTIASMQSLCESGNAGERARQQCASWGIEATDWAQIALEAARDLAVKVHELPAVSRWGLTEAFVDVAANSVTKQLVGKNLGEGCANLLDAVSKDFNPPKSNLGAYVATLDLAKHMGNAIVGFSSASAAWADNYCRSMQVSEESGRNLLLSPKEQARCRAKQDAHTSEQALKFANVVVSTLVSEYSCKTSKR